MWKVKWVKVLDEIDWVRRCMEGGGGWVKVGEEVHGGGGGLGESG